MELMYVPGGFYRPGGGGEELEGVDLYVGRFEVTQRQFAAFLAATGHHMPDEYCWVRPDLVGMVEGPADWRFPRRSLEHPAVCLTRDDATAYVRWLSERTERTFRLPRGREWEWAARSGYRANRFAGGNQWPPPFGAANIAALENVVFRYTASELDRLHDGSLSPVRHHDDYLYSAPVGEFGGSGFGLYDMTGNVWEWVSDSCGVRGGSWDNTGVALDVTRKQRIPCGSRFSALGFRVVLELELEL